MREKKLDRARAEAILEVLFWPFSAQSRGGGQGGAKEGNLKGLLSSLFFLMLKI